MSNSILIVDDDEEIRELIKDYLLLFDSQIKIIMAADGVEAFNKISKQKFDLVITDLKMPKLDGKSLLQSINSLSKNEKPKNVMVMSGHLNFTESIKKMGNVYFLSKPIDESALNTALKAIFEKEKVAVTEKKKYSIDVNFINPFIDGAILVIKTLANIEPIKETVNIKTNDLISGDISAIIGMNSQSFHGSMSISFEKKCFLEIVSNMLGERYEEINDENRDAVAEICNQIFGYAKNILNINGHSIKKAIPSIISGDNHVIKHLIPGPCLAVTFNTLYGHFTIEATISEI